MTNKERKERKEALLIALEKSLGIVTTACKKVGIARLTFYNWYAKDADFAAKVDEIKEIAFDFGESKLYKLMQDDNTAAIIFYAKTKLRHRGYVETYQPNQKEDGKVTKVIITRNKAKKQKKKTKGKK